MMEIGICVGWAVGAIVNILLADRDVGLGRLLSNMLEAEGHRVILAHEGMAAAAAFRGPAPVGLAILDGQLPVRNGFDLARWLRTGGITIPLIITSDRVDERVREVIVTLTVSQLYGRPFDSFALLDRVRELVDQPAVTASPITPKSSVILANLLLITRIWQGRLGGTLTVDGQGARRECLMGQGAPVDAEGREVVRTALYEGTAKFVEHPVEAEGVRSMLADVLYRAALKLQEKLPEEQVLIPRDLHEIEAFPIPLGIQSILKATNSRVSVGMLMGKTGQREDLNRVLCALLALGFFYVEGKDGRPRHRWQPEPPRLAPTAAPKESWSPERPLRAIAPPPWPPVPVHEVSWNRPADRVAIPPDAVFPPASVPPPRSVPPHSPISQVRGPQSSTINSNIPISSAGAAPSSPGSMTSNLTERTTQMLGWGRSQVGSALRSALTVEQHRSILQREVNNLAHASPWTILGIPADTAPDRIRVAGERMRERYLNACRSEDAQVRELGAQVLSRVEWAIANAQPVAKPVAENIDKIETFEAPGEDEGPFQEGILLAKAGKWAAADRQFSRARELESGSARNLAWLGWSRFQNPMISLDRREDEGIEYLRLAEQFDNENIESRWFLASILSKRDPDAAIRRLVRVLQLKPDHEEALGLLKKLKSGQKLG